MAKKQRKVIRDKELSALMKRIRSICGEDVKVVFRTVKGGSKLLGTMAEESYNESDDSEPEDFDNRFQRHYPKIKGRSKDLSYVG